MEDCKFQENCFLNRQIGVVLDDPWDLETTPGECSSHARLISEALKVLGIEASDDKVGQYSWCDECNKTEWRMFSEVCDVFGPVTNFEGVCAVVLIDDPSPWHCYYDKYMGKVNGAYQKGNASNMWKEWTPETPPPHHMVVYQYWFWQNHETP